MRSRLLNRNTILGFLVAVVMVVLFNSGVIAHGTASIKALLTGDSPAASAPATQELPDAPRE